MRRFVVPSLLALTSFFWINTAMAIEEPKYQVIQSEGDFEIRLYAPMLIAETEVEGDMDEASNKGFRRIADFIFGNNQTPDSDQAAKIAMTAPVTVEPQSSKIAMTAPVTVEPQTESASMITSQRWRIQFVMPQNYTLATIPKPNNHEVHLREVPGKCYVVLQYSGFNTLSRVQKKTDEARRWAEQKGLTPLATPQLARYNPPWTLPMFRRNEILIEVATP